MGKEVTTTTNNRPHFSCLHFYDIRICRIGMWIIIYDNNDYECVGCPLSILFMVFVRMRVSANNARTSFTNSSIGKSTSAPCSNKYVISASEASYT